MENQIITGDALKVLSITYILESEPGTSLKAAGYKCEGRAGGLEWNGRSKPKDEKQYPHEMKTRRAKECKKLYFGKLKESENDESCLIQNYMRIV